MRVALHGISVPCQGLLTDYTRTTEFLRTNPAVMGKYMYLRSRYRTYENMLLGKVYLVNSNSKFVALMYNRYTDNDCLHGSIDKFSIEDCLSRLVKLSTEENYELIVQPYLGFEELIVAPKQVKVIVDKYKDNLTLKSNVWR